MHYKVYQLNNVSININRQFNTNLKQKDNLISFIITIIIYTYYDTLSSVIYLFEPFSSVATT